MKTALSPKHKMTTEHQEKTIISFYEVAEYLNIFKFQSFFPSFLNRSLMIKKQFLAGCMYYHVYHSKV